MRPRWTALSDSRWRGVSPAHEHSLAEFGTRVSFGAQPLQAARPPHFVRSAYNRRPHHRSEAIAMTDISDRPWAGISRASYGSAVEYCAACVIDENQPGQPKTKSRCKLPVYEPQRLGGLLNRNAVHAAANRLLRTRGGVEAPAAVRRAAAIRLLQLYAEIGDPPPRSLGVLAGATAGHEALVLGV